MCYEEVVGVDKLVPSTHDLYTVNMACDMKCSK